MANIVKNSLYKLEKERDREREEEQKNLNKNLLRLLRVLLICYFIIARKLQTYTFIHHIRLIKSFRDRNLVEQNKFHNAFKMVAVEQVEIQLPTSDICLRK